jgi:hypothetical protein
MYTRFEDEQTIFGPVARFCPASGSAPARARILSKKKGIQIERALTAEIETGMAMHVFEVSTRANDF